MVCEGRLDAVDEVFELDQTASSFPRLTTVRLVVVQAVLVLICILCRVAEVAREHGWHPPKSLNSDENVKPEHTLFCRKLRFVAIYALFGDVWAKKVPFWVKNSVSWTRIAL